MYEIDYQTRNRYSSFIGESTPFVTVSMLFQRGIGRIWVDSVLHPQTLIAQFPRDCFAIGNLQSLEAHTIIRNLYGSLPETPGLKDALTKTWGSFAVTQAVLHEYKHDVAIPPMALGYRVEAIDENNLSQVLDFWRDEHQPGTIGDFLDYQDFLHNSFGACIIHEGSGAVVSACAAISVSKARADFGLDTSPLHEGRGLATACSHHAVQEAIRRKKQPVWVTDWDNYASQRVAVKIGFEPSLEFEIYKRLTIAEV